MTYDNITKWDLFIVGVAAFVAGRLIMNYIQPSALTMKSLNQSNIISLEDRLSKIEKALQSNLQINQQQSNTLYKNNESWEILRGEDGFISKLNALRDVKTNN